MSVFCKGENGQARTESGLMTGARVPWRRVEVSPIVGYENEMQVCITAPEDDVICCGEWGMGGKVASKPHSTARDISLAR